MKNIKLMVFVAAVLAGVVAGSLMVKRQRARASAPAIVEVRREAVPSVNTPPPISAPEVIAEATPLEPPVSETEKIPVESDGRPAAPPGQPETAAAKMTAQAAIAKKTQPVSPPAPRVRKPKEPPRDPVAREALYFVGADPRAEEYWWEAINDPSLPGHERQDLIEDLNEDGLSDPKRPTMDDLPLIVSRIELIEAIGEDAMDQVNADAFQEAYKDLLNLADVAVGAGRPVK